MNHCKDCKHFSDVPEFDAPGFGSCRKLGDYEEVNDGTALCYASDSGAALMPIVVKPEFGCVQFEALPETEGRLSDWVSVKERLPEKGVAVLTWSPHGYGQFVATYGNGWKGDEWERTGGAYPSHLPYVTDWMPLPEPPYLTLK